MTIEKQPPGLWFAFCDQCGERKELDTDPDDEFSEAVKDVKAMGWKVCPPETVRYSGDRSGDKRRKITYWTHLCTDCR